MEKLGSSLIGHGDVKMGEYQNSNLCSSSIPDCSLVVSLLFHSNINEGGAWIRNIPSLHTVIISKLCTEAHVPAPRYGQYLTHAHNHITLAMTAMDSCFTLIGAHQHCIALGSMRGETAYSLPRPFLRGSRDHCKEAAENDSASIG